MVAKSSTTGKQTSAGRKKTAASKAHRSRQSSGKATAQAKSRDQGLIILPAIKDSTDDQQAGEPRAKKAATAAKTAHKAAAHDKTAQKTRKQTAKSQHKRPDDSDQLPEYTGKTDGLRELLSCIDPLDKTYLQQETSCAPTSIENAMYLPQSRPGIPGSPDLPVAPTRWGLYLSTTLGAFAALFIVALGYSHFTSPTGINWARLQTRTLAAYDQLMGGRKNDDSIIVASNKDKASLPASLAGAQKKATGKGTKLATASRIKTTAASPKRGAIKPPSSKDIFVSPQELEQQIRALEGRKTRRISRKKAKKKARRRLRKSSRRKRIARLSKAAPAPTLAPGPFTGDDYIAPAQEIDPQMEVQIFTRARSYLKQRDISSARMILQYAAGLGSGMSAMALAETFDPYYIKKVNLHGVSPSPSDARKWYKMAASLGISEAGERLTALK